LKNTAHVERVYRLAVFGIRRLQELLPSQQSFLHSLLDKSARGAIVFNE
jgi:hypothetical protein